MIPCPNQLQLRTEPSRRGGFALVIALLLSALLLGMIMSLVTLTVTEMRLMDNAAIQQKARQNALNAAYAGMGQLQTFAGHDARITATAALLDSNPDTPTPDGIRNPWLTGVWPAQRDTSRPDDPPEVLAWLTSNGLGTDNAKDPVDPTTSLADPKPGGDTVWLLRHEVGDDPNLSVKARLIELKQKANRRSVGSNGPDEVVGHQAWWVFDEGVKARLNLALPGSDINGAENLPQVKSNVAAAPRPALWKTDDLDDFPRDSEKADRVLTYSQAALLGDSRQRGGYRNAFQHYYHSFTADSLGVLADTAGGGLRLDLNLALEMNDTEFDADDFFDGANDKPMFVLTDEVGRYVGPSWRALRDYYRAYKKMETPDGNPMLAAQILPIPRENELPPTLAANTEPRRAFTPLTSRVIFAYSAMVKPEAPETAGGPDKKLIIALDPIVTLWNPYNTKLQFDSMRIDSLIPTLHIVIEKRDLWKASREYRTNDEVYDGGTIYRATRPNRGAPPPGQNGEWADQNREWTLATDITQQQLFANYDLNYGAYILLKDPEDFSAKSEIQPGEFAIYSPNNDKPELFQNSQRVQDQHLKLIRGWNPDGGVGFDQLLTPARNLGGAPPPDGQAFVRLYSDSKVRITLEPLRDGSYPDDDPFEFIKTYPDEHFDRPDPDPQPESEDGTPLPLYAESLGFFKGGNSPIDSFDWWPVRLGNAMNFRYSTRKYTGEEEGKPLPGMSDELDVDDHLSSDHKRFLGAWDWHWKTEADLTKFPCQVIDHFSPRFGHLQRNPDGGYPATVPHYQIEARKVSSDIGIIEIMPDSNGYWGPSLSSDGANTHAPLFEAPTTPLVSLGSIQHFEFDRTPFSPGYVLGSGRANPYIQRTHSSGGDKIHLFDLPWFLNQTFADRFFFSSMTPYPGSEGVTSRIVDFTRLQNPVPLPNRRMFFFINADENRQEVAQTLISGLDDVPPYKLAATRLLLRGAFNVNSTSVEAWMAQLASLDQLSIAIRDATEEGDTVVKDDVVNLISRCMLASGPENNRWRGYRSIDDRDLKNLAEEIVKEVKRRGPFISLADLLNRRLSDDETGLNGALQAAIDRTKINGNYPAEITAGALSAATARASSEADDSAKPNFPFPEHAVGQVAASTEGFLTQGDLFQALGPQWAARSDTFKIRAYGDVIEPATGRLLARAWCELVVQRLPEYLSSTTDATAEDADTAWTAPGDLKAKINQSFGRKFRVLRMRWLAPDDV